MSDNLQSMFRSDSLAKIQAWFEEHPHLAALSGIFQVRLVLDASVIIGDLIWLVREREDPTARTNLMEVMDAGTLVALAPSDLDDEIWENIPEVAEELELSEDLLLAAWAEYRERIHFQEVNVSLQLDDVVDPDDGPYVALHLQVGEAVYTRDPHFDEMGATVVDAELIARLRDYSGAAAVEVGLRLGGVTLGTVTVELLKALFQFLKRVWKGFRSLPREFQALIGGLVLAALVHPVSRQLILDRFERLRQGSSRMLEEIRNKSQPLFTAYGNAALSATQSEDELKQKLQSASPSDSGAIA